MRTITQSKQIRAEVRRLLADLEDERIVAVAYVGADALSFLGAPKGITVYCWPQAGGTNPYAIEELVRAGVRVHFVKRLHAKVYWSKRRGALIGSANLTSNALGEDGLREAVVLVPAGAFDMNSFVESFERELDFDATLKRLHEEHVRFWQRNPKRGRPSVSPTTLPSFPKWFVGEGRADWRLGSYEEEVDAPKDAIDQLEQETGSRRFANFLSCSQRTDLKPGVFTLSFFVEEIAGVTKIKSLNWWAPKVPARTKDRSWKAEPWVWFASALIPVEAKPPFKSDVRFRNALAATIGEWGGLKWLRKASLKPTKSFLNRLYRHYESNIEGSPL